MHNAKNIIPFRTIHTESMREKLYVENNEHFIYLCNILINSVACRSHRLYNSSKFCNRKIAEEGTLNNPLQNVLKALHSVVISIIFLIHVTSRYERFTYCITQRPKRNNASSNLLHIRVDYVHQTFKSLFSAMDNIS